MASCYLHNKTIQNCSSIGTRGVFDAGLLNTVLTVLNAQGMGRMSLHFTKKGWVG